MAQSAHRLVAQIESSPHGFDNVGVCRADDPRLRVGVASKGCAYTSKRLIAVRDFSTVRIVGRHCDVGDLVQEEALVSDSVVGVMAEARAARGTDV